MSTEPKTPPEQPLDMMEQARSAMEALGQAGWSYVDGVWRPAAEVMEMWLCEASRIVLRVDQLYRFKVDPDCPSCQTQAEKATQAYSEGSEGTVTSAYLQGWPLDRLTPWFPSEVKPVRVGVYERDYNTDYPTYAYWNGTYWGLCGSSVQLVRANEIPSADQSRPWRGLNYEPTA